MRKKASMFFFEKKNQETFIRARIFIACGRRVGCAWATHQDPRRAPLMDGLRSHRTVRLSKHPRIEHEARKAHLG
jgi:hypothetical protein